MSTLPRRRPWPSPPAGTVEVRMRGRRAEDLETLISLLRAVGATVWRTLDHVYQYGETVCRYLTVDLRDGGD